MLQYDLEPRDQENQDIQYLSLKYISFLSGRMYIDRKYVIEEEMVEPLFLGTNTFHCQFSDPFQVNRGSIKIDYGVFYLCASVMLRESR